MRNPLVRLTSLNVLLCAGCAAASPPAKIAPFFGQPMLVVSEAPSLISGTPPFPIPPEHAVACEQVAELANKTRARGHLFYEVPERYREIAPPKWERVDIRQYVKMIVEAKAADWCDDPMRVNEATRRPFSETDRESCREAKEKRVRKSFRGDVKFERATIDIDRDGDGETVYQITPDPDVVREDVVPKLVPAVTASLIMPSVFVFPKDDESAAREVRRAHLGPVSLFYWRSGLYALSGGSLDQYSIFLLVSSRRGLGELPICELKPKGENNDQREDIGRS